MRSGSATWPKAVTLIDRVERFVGHSCCGLQSIPAVRCDRVQPGRMRRVCTMSSETPTGTSRARRVPHVNSQVRGDADLLPDAFDVTPRS